MNDHEHDLLAHPVVGSVCLVCGCAPFGARAVAG
jgi:hypothetical protein